MSISEGPVRTHQLGSRQPFLWVSLPFWMVCAVFAWAARETLAAAVLGAFALLTLFALRSRASVTLDHEGITHQSRFGVHRLRWDEIRRVETDGVTLVLLGDAKQFPVAPRFWARESRAWAEAFLERELSVRLIPRVDNPVASRRVFRNTRQRSSAGARGAAPARRG